MWRLCVTIGTRSQRLAADSALHSWSAVKATTSLVLLAAIALGGGSSPAGGFILARARVPAMVEIVVDRGDETAEVIARIGWNF